MSILFELEILEMKYLKMRYQDEEKRNKCLKLIRELKEAEKERTNEFEERMFK